MTTATPARTGTPYDRLVERRAKLAERAAPAALPPSPPSRPSRPKRRPVVPGRSLDQRFQALDRANDVRMARAEFKRKLKAGRASAVAAILNPPAELETMTAFNLIIAIPRYGRVRANKILSAARIAQSRTLGGLSPRQREEFAAVLRFSQPAA